MAQKSKVFEQLGEKKAKKKKKCSFLQGKKSLTVYIKHKKLEEFLQNFFA